MNIAQEMYAEEENRFPFKYLMFIFSSTKRLGIFPLNIVRIAGGRRKCNYEAIHSCIPLTLTIFNIFSLFWIRLESYPNEWMISTEMITHLNVLICIFIHHLYNKTLIPTIEDWLALSRIQKQTSSLSNTNILILISFVVWSFVSLLQLIKLSSTIRLNFLGILLFLESTIVPAFEFQLCVILDHIANALNNLTDETVAEVKRRRKNRIKEFRYVEPTLINLRSIRKYEAINFSVESWRIHHRTIVTIMDNLNMIYSVPNFALAISQRSLLVLYLYFWLSTSEISYMALASVNFIRTALIFYCFQILKNKETELKSAVGELSANYSNSEEKRKFKIFADQVRTYDIIFKAGGMFSMDFNNVMSILITSAGYLFLLSELNL